MNVKARIIAVLVAALACVALLGGCAADAKSDAQTQNRQYMSSVNSIMSDMDDSMKEFSTAVKDGEVLSLSSELSTVNKCVDRLKAIQAPEALKDVNSKYVNGAEELQTALKLYVELYEDVKAPKSGSFDYSKYGDRLSKVKEHYDAGIKALQEADEAVSKA
ncbi:MAG: hypothetical protein Q4F23_06570 [Coriobacteriia bacterium]|nr:hypothetical protein [Coriobacteriia bacterium]